MADEETRARYFEEAQKRRVTYPITDQEYRFVMEYIVDFDAGRAFASCYAVYGNPEIPGRKILARPDIQAVIAIEISEQGKALFLTKEAILARTWQEALNQRSKPAERLKALELTAKLIGALDEKRDERQAPTVQITISDPHNLVVAQKAENSRMMRNISMSGERPMLGPVIEMSPDEVPVDHDGNGSDS